MLENVLNDNVWESGVKKVKRAGVELATTVMFVRSQSHVMCCLNLPRVPVSFYANYSGMNIPIVKTKSSTWEIVFKEFSERSVVTARDAIGSLHTCLHKMSNAHPRGTVPEERERLGLRVAMNILASAEYCVHALVLPEQALKLLDEVGGQLLPVCRTPEVLKLLAEARDAMADVLIFGD